MCHRCRTRRRWKTCSCPIPRRSRRRYVSWRPTRLGATTRVVMPQLGESVHEGTISKWLVKLGDKVVEFEPMLEVDTDKVSAEVPAPVTGILREILAKEGETVQAGAEIAVVEVGGDGEAPAALEPDAPAAEVAPQAPAPAPADAPAAEKDGETPASPPEPKAAPARKPDSPLTPSSPPAGEVPPGARSGPRGGGGAVAGQTGAGVRKTEP